MTLAYKNAFLDNKSKIEDALIEAFVCELPLWQGKLQELQGKKRRWVDLAD